MLDARLFCAAKSRRWLIERGQLSESARPGPGPGPLEVPVSTPRMSSWPSAAGPVETADLIRRLASPGFGPEAVEEVARRVAERLGDVHSLAWYRIELGPGTIGRVAGEASPVGVAAGPERYVPPPGSVFNDFLKRGGR